jgi:acyl transferase domain-containing protein
VDTACSSSLVALHLACESIWNGDSSSALVGGSNAILKPEMTLGFGYANMLAQDGRCKSFDARANGYVRAEGAGMLLLKPLAAAQRNGDRIYSVILATTINQDGQTPGISVPNGESQAALVREACAKAGIRPRDVQFVETHGTGTPVGDPIEATALGRVVGEGRPADAPCILGSVKSNIGHLEAGAGLAGVMKVALSLFHGAIPPNLHFQSPNPQIDMDRLCLRRLSSSLGRKPTARPGWPASTPSGSAAPTPMPCWGDRPATAPPFATTVCRPPARPGCCRFRRAARKRSRQWHRPIAISSAAEPEQMPRWWTWSIRPACGARITRTASRWWRTRGQD